MSRRAALHRAALPAVLSVPALALARMLTSASVMLRRICTFVFCEWALAVALGVRGEYADRL